MFSFSHLWEKTSNVTKVKKGEKWKFLKWKFFFEKTKLLFCALLLLRSINQFVKIGMRKEKNMNKFFCIKSHRNEFNFIFLCKSKTWKYWRKREKTKNEKREKHRLFFFLVNADVNCGGNSYLRWMENCKSFFEFKVFFWMELIKLF